MSFSYVVTGGGRGIGRAIVERLLDDSNSVVAIEFDSSTLEWVGSHPAGSRVMSVIGDASDEAVAEKAADLAQNAAPLLGWVNNAAIFRDASLHTAPVNEVFELISRNFKPALVGCAVAVRRFIAAGTGGAIVNISSHQATRAVPGCLPYVTAKAATEGMARALAVEYGARGIRVNTVALGSVSTERYEDYLSRQTPEALEHIEKEMALLHPLGRVGSSQEVADAVAYLLSNAASFISGVTLPVDGGRSVLGRDPEEYKVA
jgi:NAD(P)-dependent dehydrogenase (short-subunit alcohol dehydrogenase family)